MNRILPVVLLITTLAIAVSGQSINLSGKVTNKNGKAISGAIVTLAGKKISDTTDATGAYTIKSATVPVLPTPIVPGTEHISMNKGIIKLSLIKPLPVKIELFTMNGHLIDKLPLQQVSAGDYYFNVASHPLATTMMAIRVTMGEKSMSFRYIPFENGRNARITTVQSISSKSNLTAGFSELMAVVDSLKVTAANYVSNAVQITSYTETVNITLDSSTLSKFSFFVTSQKVLQELSKNTNGFGGDFRFGKTGPGAGLKGADSICECIAEKSMPGSKVKIWRAFLSATKDENGKQVNAISRIGKGPWYDRMGRLLANDTTELLNARPKNADPAIKNDLPNEEGVPNHYPNGTKVDNHHMVTGSGTDGKLYSSTATCDDWTSTTYTTTNPKGKPQCGFAWPRVMGGTSGSHWISGFAANGCEAGYETIDNGGGARNTKIIGSGGGYGGFYCFALNP